MSNPDARGVTPEDRLGIDLARSELNLVRQLVQARERRGIKPAEVARRMGVDRSVITRFESGGTNPTMATINRYAEAVGVMITYEVTDPGKQRDRLNAFTDADWPNLVVRYVDVNVRERPRGSLLPWTPWSAESSHQPSVVEMAMGLS